MQMSSDNLVNSGNTCQARVKVATNNCISHPHSHDAWQADSARPSGGHSTAAVRAGLGPS